MERKNRVWAFPAVTLLVLATTWTAFGQEKSRTEKIKEKVGSAVRSAEEAIKGQYNRAKEAVLKMEVEARVYARLHWDKALAESKIDLTAPKKGTIKLSGTVTDAKAKAKAVELATETVGVSEVVDDLTVQSAAKPEPPRDPK
jgi:hyperosmotically inducible periplasmic protein